MKNNDSIQQTILKNIDKLILENSKNSIDFCTKAGLNPEFYQNYKSKSKIRKNLPNLNAIVQIAQTYNVSIDWICGLTDDPKSHIYRSNTRHTD